MSERTAIVVTLVGVVLAAAGLVLSPWPWLALLFAGLALGALGLFAEDDS